MNSPPDFRDRKFMRSSILRKLRGFALLVVTLAGAGPALAAGEVETCQNRGLEPAARLASCESVIADDKITGKPKADAFWFRGDTLNRKRDYDGAIAAYS